MEQILLAYGLPLWKFYLYKNALQNTISFVRLVDEDTNIFDIVTSVLLEDTLSLYLFILCKTTYLECQ